MKKENKSTMQGKGSRSGKRVRWLIVGLVLTLAMVITMHFTLLEAEEAGAEQQQQEATRWGKRKMRASLQPLSTLDCSVRMRACLLQNLHVNEKKELHAYVGEATSLSPEERTNLLEWNLLDLYTGIGSGTPTIRLFILSECFPDSITTTTSNHNTDAVVEAQREYKRRGELAPPPPMEWLNTTDMPLRIHLYVHCSLPPTTASPSSLAPLKEFSEPLIVASILWDNLFRTLYAAAGIWYSMLYYRVFFPSQFRIALVDVNPIEKYLYLIEAITPHPIHTMFPSKSPSFLVNPSLTEVPTGVYKASVLGIVRWVLVEELIAETHWEYRQYLQQQAFRFLGQSLKMQLLNLSRQEAWQPIPSDLELRDPTTTTSLSSAAVTTTTSTWTGTSTTASPSHHRHQSDSIDFTAFSTLDIKSFLETECSASKRDDFPPLNATIVSRSLSQTRQIVNISNLVAFLEEYLDPCVNIRVFEFEKLSMEQQLRVVHETDVLIAMHGAALTQAIFLRPGSYVLELFPFGFRKAIYQNVCRLVGVYYWSWQNTHWTQTKFPDWVGKTTTNINLERITHLPIDWYNMDSKNYWRNQDTDVSILEIMGILRSILLHREFKLHSASSLSSLLPSFTNPNTSWLQYLRKSPWKSAFEHQTKQQSEHFLQPTHSSLTNTLNSEFRFLLYMPWEQFNNQRLGFISACALSYLLDRVLVLPKFGTRIFLNVDEEREGLEEDRVIPFNSSHFDWKPFGRYFDETWLQTWLPCEIISLENFYSLTNGRSIGKLRYHSLGANVTSEQQMMEFYSNVYRLKFDEEDVLYENVYYQLSKEEILEFYGQNSDPVLALGSMFWFYDFGRKQIYPLEGFVDYLSVSPLYHQIRSSLRPHEEIMQLVQAAMRRETGPDIAIHLRRGDYKGKCKTLPEHLYMHCYQSDSVVVERAKEILLSPTGFFFSSSASTSSSGEPLVIYLSTNEKPSKVDELQNALFLSLNSATNRSIEIVTLSEVTQRTAPLWRKFPEYLDTLDQILIDELICTKSHVFLGNFYSSFTRSVVENRMIQNGNNNTNNIIFF